MMLPVTFCNSANTFKTHWGGQVAHKQQSNVHPCTGCTAHSGSRGIFYPCLTTTLEGGEGSVSCPSHSLPPGKTRCPLYRRMGGPQGRSGQVRKISPPPGFNPWTVQPVASRYTSNKVVHHKLSIMVQFNHEEINDNHNAF
jgi:hypothetical protein